MAIKKADGDQRDIQIGCALDVIARQHAEAAGINRHRFVDAELSGKIRHRTRSQHAGVSRTPGPVRVEILLLPAIGVVDAAVQHQFARAALDSGQRHFRKQRNGIVIQRAKTHRIELTKNGSNFVIPAPAEITGHAPTIVRALAR